MDQEAEGRTQKLPGAVVAAPAPFRVTDLLVPGAYAHPVSNLRLIETSLSWVLLTGDYAYKIKKPVSLGHLDFSTLALRHAACFEELRLNRRYAPEIYLDFVPITAAGSSERLQVDGLGPALEYAVKKREFPQPARLDRLLAAGSLGHADIDALAAAIADFHGAARVAPVPASQRGPGLNAQAGQAGQEDLLGLAAQVDGPTRERLHELGRWSAARGRALASLMKERRSAGFVRELHGDLRLENIVQIGSQLRPFDCIEFSAELRWIDVINDLAYLTMDLDVRGRSDLAYRLLNRYLEINGDYAGVPLLRYFEVYRALIGAARALEPGAAAEPGTLPMENCQRHVQLAAQRCRPDGPTMILMHGLAGSGKTWLSERLMTALPALRVRAEVERKRLGVAPPADTRSPPNTGLIGSRYLAAESARILDHLAAAATSILQGGENVIVDATFLSHADRQRFRELAGKLDIPFVIVSCRAPVEELGRRMAERLQLGLDASRADEAVLQHQVASAEPLDEHEQLATLFVETGDPAQVEAIIARLRADLLTDGADDAPPDRTQPA